MPVAASRDDSAALPHESRIAAAVTRRGERADRDRREAVRRPASSPEARQKTTSPSTSENTGSTARATPPLAIRATRAQAGLVERRVGHHADERRVALLAASSSRAASLIAATQLGGRQHLAVVAARPRQHRPSSPITSPNALTTASAATVSPRPARAPPRSRPRPAARSRPRIFPTAAPVPGADPAPLRDARGRRVAGRIAGVRARARLRVALGEVVDHRRGDDRHQPRRASRSRARAPRASASRRRRPPARRRCRR